ncbi:MAG: glycosyltransferase [Fibromonadaceae bacterium]|jgi:cellulose synthase/poly-beta-1,6-N-acetylglucosamine synthase-like glycosyltransferase|nr:glycosyltransferase [Fibromonadaceae bacterium]
MVATFLLDALFVLYVFAGVGLVLYGFNCYFSIFLFLKNFKKNRKNDKEALENFLKNLNPNDLPKVTTQLPVFNEGTCVERLIENVCAMEYPRHLHEIQVLDDSTDDCIDISRRKVAEMKERGYNISLIHRTVRPEYKAGALKAGMAECEGEFLAIFDADFVPEKNFLMHTIPYLVMDKKIGLVQGRWGHLNRGESGLTLAQSIGIDGHFVIEQSARSWGGLFMNFNGTAGVWRREAIDSAGGWQGDTLTEDMDLSYRSQLAGWKMKFVFDVIVPAELPADVNAFKSQQYRWAKGSLQTAIKVLPQVFKSKVSPLVKYQSFMHTTHYSIHPLMLFTAVSAFPLLAFGHSKLASIPIWLFTIIFTTIALAAIAPSTLYFVAQKFSGSIGWKRRMAAIPLLMSLGVGIAVSNTCAVFSAITGRKSSFIRTPKQGGNTRTTNFKQKFPKLSFIELFVGAYCVFGLLEYIDARIYLIGPFLALYAIGFLAIGTLSILHYIGDLRTSQT